MTPLAVIIALGFAASPADDYEGLYDRIVKDTRAGLPVVVTVYVALCDAEHQGVVVRKYPQLCTGSPARNLYWTTRGGIKGYLDGEGWQRLIYEEPRTGAIAARGVWQKGFSAGPALVERGSPEEVAVQVVGLAYRGPSIRRATSDFLDAVGSDAGSTLSVAGSNVAHGGSSHIIGLMGHNYLMDITERQALLARAKEPTRIDKGAFVLACISDDYFRSALTKPHSHILLLNTRLTYPTGWTVGGMLAAILAGDGPEELRRKAAAAYARIQKKTLAEVLPMFSNVQPRIVGDKDLP